MEQLTAEKYITLLGLEPHPEGGYYLETHRDERGYGLQGTSNHFPAKRNFSTAIYFLVSQGNFSAFHRIRSDEVWHFYTGDALEIVEITAGGELKRTKLGSRIGQGEVFQYVVKAGNWFGSRVLADGAFALVGCTVAPGFDFADFEMAEREKLLQEFPRYKEVILELTRS